MSHVEGEILIARPIEEVFDFVADECNEPRYNPRMIHSEKLTEGPVDRGTLFQATTRSGRGTAEMVIEVTEFHRPSRLASTTTLSSMDIRGLLTFEPVGEATRMRWSWDIQPHGALRLMGPVVTLLGRRQELAVWTGLKKILETRAA